MSWRIGQSWGNKENPLLVTIVEEGIRSPTRGEGRRPDDRLVGCAGPADAARICEAVNLYERQLGEMLERHAKGLHEAARELTNDE